MRSLLPLFLLLACSAHGPRTLPRDRQDYSTAIGKSWNRELLLNIVRIRYLDMPVFLDVQQILAGYTYETGASAGWTEAGLASGWGFSGSGRYIDRPTITFRPRAGAVFAKNIMTPIEPRAILYLLQAGYAADFVMPMCVDSINGLRNGSGTVSGQAKTDPRFTRMVELFATIQKGGGLGMRIEKSEKDPRGALILVMRPENEAPTVLDARKEVIELLRLEPGRGTYEVEYSSRSGGGNLISMQPRSVLQIMFEMSTEIDAPPEHVKKGFVVPGLSGDDRRRLMRVQSGSSEPSDAFVSVRYNDHWFWITHDDLVTKRTFTFMNLLSAFVESEQPSLPTLVTVPG